MTEPGVVYVNGKSRPYPAPLTLAALLAEVGVGSEGVAVAIDREVVPRSAYADRVVREGARVEVLRAVGGG